MAKSRKMASEDLRSLCTLGLLIALMLTLKLLGLDNIMIGPLKTSFLTVPVAIGAMMMGIEGGTILGAAFGVISFYDAVNGSGGLTNIFFGYSVVHTMILCIGMRMLMGFFTALIFKAVKKVDKTNTICYFVGGLLAPMLNTVFFMSYIVLVFYQTEKVQSMVASKGAANAFMFIILTVGVQGLIEWATGLIIGGSVGKGLSKALKQ